MRRRTGRRRAPAAPGVEERYATCCTCACAITTTVQVLGINRCAQTWRVWPQGEISSIFFATREAGSGPTRPPRLAVGTAAFRGEPAAPSCRLQGSP
jgi:hypothetical protein